MRTSILAFLLALASICAAKGSPDRDYSVHEWGTFTSVQGSDGAPLAWDPFTTTDLPGFVYDRKAPTDGPALERSRDGFAALDLKGSRAWLQRMETPVIYFHSASEQVVDVKVRFPGGLLTEWFPQVTTFGPVWGVSREIPDSKESHLRWDRVRILGADASLDPKWMATLPVEKAPSHYYPARKTGGNLLEVTRPFSSEPVVQRDRVLFYRGAGDFIAPLRVGIGGTGELVFDNAASEILGPVFVFRFRGDRAWLQTVPAVAAHSRQTVHWNEPAEGRPPTVVADEARREMKAALTAAGLFADESAAMVETWRDAWFEEKGLRVLYLLPRRWTDQILPLEIQPPPRDLVRVMVARADVLEPDVEDAAAKAFARFKAGDTDAAVREIRRLELGRIADAAVTRVGLLSAAETRRELAERCQGAALSTELEKQQPAMRQRLESFRELLRKAQTQVNVASAPAAGLQWWTPAVE